jgi:hypothetical protein
MHAILYFSLYLLCQSNNNIVLIKGITKVLVVLAESIEVSEKQWINASGPQERETSHLYQKSESIRFMVTPSYL